MKYLSSKVNREPVKSLSAVENSDSVSGVKLGASTATPYSLRVNEDATSGIRSSRVEINYSGVLISEARIAGSPSTVPNLMSKVSPDGAGSIPRTLI